MEILEKNGFYWSHWFGSDSWSLQFKILLISFQEWNKNLKISLKIVKLRIFLLKFNFFSRNIKMIIETNLLGFIVFCFLTSTTSQSDFIVYTLDVVDVSFLEMFLLKILSQGFFVWGSCEDFLKWKKTKI
jgi:hypothetical protein